MDIVLLIIAICFRCGDSEHSYTALTVLSIIGLLISLILMLGTRNWFYAADIGLYIIDLLVCGTAKNKVLD